MKSINTTPVTGFEIDRYLGKWYEIARFPHGFEKGLTAVTATYTPKNNGKIEVLNEGYKGSPDGRYSKAKGKAKFAGDPGTGHLKVSFFLFFYADYYIMDLDQQNYQWALVGSSSPGYLWILSRQPVISDSLYNEIVAEARNRGYDTSQLIKVEQPGE